MNMMQDGRFGAGWRGMGAVAPMQRSATFSQRSSGREVRRGARMSLSSADTSHAEKHEGR